MRIGLRLAAAVAALWLAGCGSSSPVAPEGQGSAQNFTGSVAAYGTTSHAVVVTRAETLTVTLTWAGGADLDLYLTGIDCTGYPPDNCLILARSTASSGTREEIQWPAAANDRFKIWVDNFSPTAASDYTVVTAVR